MNKIRVILIALIILALIYLAGINAYKTRIVPNTFVGGADVSLTTFKDFEDLANETFGKQTININDAVIKDYSVTVGELGASIDSAKLLNDIKGQQSLFRWPAEIAAKSNFELKDYMKIDDKVLKKKLTDDKFFEKEGRVEAKAAKLKLNEDTNNYEVEPGKDGTEIDEDKLVEDISNSIINSQTKVNTENSYITADSDEEKLTKDAEKLNERINRDVSMSIDEDVIKVPKSIVANALFINDEDNVDIEGTELYNYLYNQSLEYDSAQVGFGYRTVTESNVDPAYMQIKEGLLSDENKPVVGVATIEDEEDTFKPTVVTDEPTYIEISIGKQIMWVFKDGELLVQTPVVTGNVAQGWDTPTGKYSIIEKTTDKVLDGSTVGYDYKVPVNYWMRLTNSGVGIHDIDWLNTDNAWDSRDVYTSNGSHGCINTPSDVMGTVYNSIAIGTPVYITD